MRKFSRVKLSHGSGGIETHRLIDEVVRSKVDLRKILGGLGLDEMDDSATIPLKGEAEVVITTDSYTVNPIFFPGGNIGSLAATGMINDLAVMGAKPAAALDAIVVEEGFPIEQLNEIVQSFVNVIKSEGIALIGGDLKVMPKKTIDKIVITTSGIGFAIGEVLSDSEVKIGDKIIVSGGVGEHGAAILAAQMGVDVEGENLKSDHSPVTKVMEAALKVGGIHAAKDPTRGGLAMALNEFARKSGVMIVVEEEKIPVRDPVKSYSEMLGIDPLVLACEGRVVMSVENGRAERVVEEIRKLGYSDASIIGEVREGKKGYVILKTVTGGMRLLEPPTGEIVPRIC